MAFAKVIEVFDDAGSVRLAVHELITTGVATGGTLRVEPEYLDEDLHPLEPRSHKPLREKIKEWFDETSDGDFSRSDHRFPPGLLFLVATIPEGNADKALEIMHRYGGRDRSSLFGEHK
jgi:hypothetical protein